MISHGKIIAHDIGFATFAQAYIFPVLVAGHDVVDTVDRHLKYQHSDLFGAIEYRGSDKRCRGIVGRVIRFEIDQFDKVLIARLACRLESPGKIGLPVRTGQQGSCKIYLLENRVNDVPGFVVDQENIVVTKLFQKTAYAGVKFLMHPAVKAVVN